MPKTYRQPEIGLEYEFVPGRAPVVVFLPGFASDMNGTKALLLRDACAAAGQAFLRLDYAGHGASGGRFEDGCIGDWAADAAHVIGTAAGEEKLLLVGSSMGGWISLLLALRFRARMEGLLLIAPAPDFTETILPRLTPAQREALERDGFLLPPSQYGPPAPMTRRLLEEGGKHLLLGGAINIHCPVRVLHGMQDPDVPWERSLKLAECLASDDVRLIFVKDAGHRLSRDTDLRLLRQTLTALLGEDGA